MRVVEAASFVAAPTCGLYLAQFGAEVIRIDQIGGGPDFMRWPLSPDGAHSLYWEGINKGKKSVALDLGRPEGRELAVALITAGGPEGGLFTTNFPADGFLSYERLRARRADLICLRVMGWPDGRPALDYTVNAAVGMPYMTGPKGFDGPVNHVLPAWDLLTGAYAASALLAAERARRMTGEGREVRIALSDVAIASMGNLGLFGEIETTGHGRARHGNDLYGAFGRDFVTADGRTIMVLAITVRQWRAMVEVLGLGPVIERLETELGVNFTADEGARFRHHDRLAALVEGEVRKRDLASLAEAFDRTGACWAPYQTLEAALAEDPQFSTGNPMLQAVDHPSGHRYRAPGPVAATAGAPRGPVRPAPALGQDTEEVLADVVGLPSAEIGRLIDAGLAGRQS